MRLIGHDGPIPGGRLLAAPVWNYRPPEALVRQLPFSFFADSRRFKTG
jgi:hypothetical protein